MLIFYYCYGVYRIVKNVGGRKRLFWQRKLWQVAYKQYTDTEKSVNLREKTLAIGHQFAKLNLPMAFLTNVFCYRGTLMKGNFDEFDESE